MVYAICVHENELVRCLLFGNVGAGMVAVAEVDDVTELAQVNGLEEITVPAFDTMEIQALVCMHGTTFAHRLGFSALVASNSSKQTAFPCALLGD